MSIPRVRWWTLAIALSTFACSDRVASMPATTTLRFEPISLPPAAKPRVLASASALSMATTDRFVIYGDADAHAVFAVPKTGGSAVRLGEGNPIAIAVATHTIAWIAAPGDVLRRVSRHDLTPLSDVHPFEDGGEPQRFTAIAADDEDLLASETSASGGLLVRVRKGDVTRVASFEGRAHALMHDGLGTYLATPSEVLLVPNGGSFGQLVTAGADLAGLVVSSAHVVTTSDAPTTGRGLLRAPKAGGGGTWSRTHIRCAPIAMFREHIYFFDRDLPVLRRMPLAGGEAVVVARAPELSWVVALTVDASGIYVAANHGRAPSVLAFVEP